MISHSVTDECEQLCHHDFTGHDTGVNLAV